MARKSTGRPRGNPARHLRDEQGAYWHGGPPGLKVGDVLTGGRAMPQAQKVYAEREVEYADGVYVTTDKLMARSYAAQYGGRQLSLDVPGWLYRVAPDGELLVDPDYALLPDHISWVCSSATIVKVEEKDVRMSETDIVRIGARHMVWNDGTPQYDSAGYMNWHPEHEQEGITPEMLRSMGPWRNMRDPRAQAELHWMIAISRGDYDESVSLSEYLLAEAGDGL